LISGAAAFRLPDKDPPKKGSFFILKIIEEIVGSLTTRAYL